MNRRHAADIHHRRSVRLRGYDYSQAGAYFVTIVTQDRLCLFGDVVRDEMRLNTTGRLVEAAWKWLGTRYPHVELDMYVVMPNHLHGIIVIVDRGRGGSRSDTVTRGQGGSRTAPTRKPLGRLIGAFKTVVTRQVNLALNTPGQQLWQRNYYEHVIRDEDELGRAREYIVDNPMKWALDSENPAFAIPGETRVVARPRDRRPA